MQFYTGDWFRHAGLRSCSLQARGLAIDLVCLMQQAEPYGHLRAGKKELSSRDLARIVGGARSEVERLLKELLNAGVFDRTPEGRIYSPRMVRDEQKRAQSREHGARGGNPALAPRSKPLDNRTLNPGDNPPHARARSEVRSQRSDSPAASEQRRRPGDSRDTTQGHSEAIRVWCSQFERETGRHYAFDGSADGKQIKRLLKFPDFSLDELERRAALFLRDPFWAERGVDLKRFVAQWVPVGNAGRKVEPRPKSNVPSAEEREWCRRALNDPNPVNQEEGRKRLARWGMSEADLTRMPT